MQGLSGSPRISPGKHQLNHNPSHKFLKHSLVLKARLYTWEILQRSTCKWYDTVSHRHLLYKKMNATLNKPVRSRMWACPHCSGPDCKPCPGTKAQALCLHILLSIRRTWPASTGRVLHQHLLAGTWGWSGSEWALGKDCCWILNADVPSAHVLKVLQHAARGRKGRSGPPPCPYSSTF